MACKPQQILFEIIRVLTWMLTLKNKIMQTKWPPYINNNHEYLNLNCISNKSNDQKHDCQKRKNPVHCKQCIYIYTCLIKGYALFINLLMIYTNESYLNLFLIRYAANIIAPLETEIETIRKKTSIQEIVVLVSLIGVPSIWLRSSPPHCGPMLKGKPAVLC